MEDWLPQDRDAFLAAQAQRNLSGVRLWALVALIQSAAAVSAAALSGPEVGGVPFVLPLGSLVLALGAAAWGWRDPVRAAAATPWLTIALALVGIASTALVLVLSPQSLGLVTVGLILISLSTGLLFSWTLTQAVVVQLVMLAGWVLGVTFGPGWHGDPATLVASAPVVVGGAVVAISAQRYRRMVEADRMRHLCELERAAAVVDSERQRVRESGFAKDQLFSDVTNGLREPVVRMLRDLHRQLEATPDQRDRLLPLWQDGLRLLRKLDDLGSLALIQRGYLRLRAQRVDLRGEVERIVAPVQERVERLGLTVDVSFNAIPEDVHIDPVRFERVLLAMLAEALRRCAADADVQVEVSVDTNATGVDLVRIEVWCEGDPEVEEEALDDDFWREPEGTRVEMRLARALAELHGGRLTEPDAGASMLSWNLVLRAGTAHLLDEVIDRRVRDRGGGRGRRFEDREGMEWAYELSNSLEYRMLELDVLTETRR